MKLILTITAFVAFITTATAGSLAEPVIEVPIIVEDATSYSSGTVTVVLRALLLMIPALDCRHSAGPAIYWLIKAKHPAATCGVFFVHSPSL